MFGRKKDPETNAILKREREQLRTQIRELKDKVADLKHEKKLSDEDIKHMVRIEKERIEVENEKKQLERDRVQQEAIAKVKDEYRDKMERRLETEVKNIKSMYDEILKRLPTVTVRQQDVRSEHIEKSG